jgi:large subunit ribosomal protein L19
MNAVQSFDQRQTERLMANKQPIPEFGPGDSLSVYVRIREGERERVQRFEGLCIARRYAGLHSSFLVRRVTDGVGIERRFALYSPLIDHIECTRRGKVRRNKLYYVRSLSRKQARIKEKVVRPSVAAAPVAN